MSFPYTGAQKIRFADTDANGHTYFATYLILADEVSGEYWAELGWDFNEIHQQPTLTFTVNANIDFISECLGADWVDVGVRFSRLGNSSLTLEWEMTNRRTGETAARGSFVSVFVDKADRKSCPIPSELREAILARQPELG
ncbi:MAG: acyl-CoA thioesterase [Luminiphilus sp.]|nr:acyl-CoA thioesterase [Luminiphilus sp.]